MKLQVKPFVFALAIHPARTQIAGKIVNSSCQRLQLTSLKTLEVRRIHILTTRRENTADVGTLIR